MVFDMADPVGNRVEPADEGIHLEEEIIQESGFERRLVTEFMAGGAAKETGAGAMGEECCKQERNRPGPVRGVDVPVGEKCQCAGCGKESELRDDLGECTRVAFAQETAHHGLVHRGAIPVDFAFFVHR